MDLIEQGYSQVADLNLWLKEKTGEPLVLSDISILIKMRTQYIFDNWNFIRTSLIKRLDSYLDPDRFKREIDAFDRLISTTGATSKKPNEKTLLTNFFTIFDNIIVNDLQISSQEQLIIDNEMARVSKFTRNNFIYMRNDMVVARDTIADNINGADDTYNSIYNRSSAPAMLDKNISSINTSHQFQKSIAVIDMILANTSLIEGQATIDPFAFAKSNANNPNFEINSHSSGRLIKLNYGETLPQLSTRVFGNPDRWQEIAIANGLKPPYIDEIGEKIPLIANARDNLINISERTPSYELTSEKVYINQIIMIQSNAERYPDQRTIVSITTIPVSGELMIELSGDSNLNKYTLADSAYIRVFKPNTINSNFFIMIPTDDPQAAQLPGTTPWFLKSSPSDEKSAGVDLFIDENGDLSFTQFGDIQLSYGIANHMQALTTLLATSQGDLVRHSGYGVQAVVGENNMSIEETRQAIAANIAEQIGNDARFDRLESLSVKYVADKGPTKFLVSLVVVLAGTGTAIPITFTVNPN